jgi:hypothetical protein
MVLISISTKPPITHVTINNIKKSITKEFMGNPLKYAIYHVANKQHLYHHNYTYSIIVDDPQMEQYLTEIITAYFMDKKPLKSKEKRLCYIISLYRPIEIIVNGKTIFSIHMICDRRRELYIINHKLRRP